MLIDFLSITDLAPYPSGKGEVCKTFMHRFESGRRLSNDDGRRNIDATDGVASSLEALCPKPPTIAAKLVELRTAAMIAVEVDKKTIRIIY